MRHDATPRLPTTSNPNENSPNRRPRLVLHDARFCCFHQPAGGSFAFPSVVDGRSGAPAATRFCDALMASHRIMAVPSPLFGIAGDSRMRVTYGREEAVAVCARFAQALRLAD